MFAEIVGTEEGRRDPYPGYARLRAQAPVYRSGLGFTVCTRYEECDLVLRDPRFGKDERDRREALRERFGSVEMFPPEFLDMSRERRSMLFLNPPDHTRLRSLVSRAFTPRTVEQLRPEIVALVDGLLDGFPEGEPVDVMNQPRLPAAGGGDRPPARRPERGLEAFQGGDGSGDGALGAGHLPRRAGAGDRGPGRARGLFPRARRRTSRPAPRRPRQQPHRRGGRLGPLTELELIGTAILIFGAGFETTTNLIGNGLLALLTHPEEMARLRGDPGLCRSAVDELLRFDSPVQFDGRLALEDTVVAGVRLRRHEEIITILGAANRDPARFSDPDTLDLGRDEGPPLSFAAGIHFCLGAALARAEGQVVFGRLLERFGSIELAADTPVFRNRITLRGLSSLPVVLGR